MLSKPAILLLGLIHREPNNAYEILKLLSDMHIRHWFDIPDSTVYTTIKTLEKKKYIAGRTAKDGNMPEKTIYSITPEGHKTLVESLEEILSGFDYDTMYFTVAAFSINAIETDQAKQLFQKRIHLLDTINNALKQRIDELGKIPVPRYSISNIERMRIIVEAEMKGTQELLNAL